jgi:hypothetical protein
MNFNTFLQKLQEATATPKIGESSKKDRAKSNAIDQRTKDAARKRAERAKAIPRERKSKQELVKEVIAVKTNGGNIQLIFKDSFNKEQHQKISKDVLTIDEAQQVAKDPKFEQTRASKLLLGEVKRKEESEKKEAKPKKESEPEKGKKEKGSEKKDSKTEEKPKPKPKRMSKDDIFQAMQQMDGNQLATLPLDIRQEYFKAARKPPTNIDFDNYTYEGISVRYGISPISSLPYNQQVLNALVFLAKIKAGASDQEMQTYTAMAPAATEFTRTAFNTAKKILSQIGEGCIQNLVSNIEMGAQSVNSEGSVDMECGNYKFKISAGGELALSTTQFDQANKSFKGLLSGALTQSLSDPRFIQSDPKLAELFNRGIEETKPFGDILISDQMLPEILADENLTKELMKLKIKNDNGEDLGAVIDENGSLNPNASLSNYQNMWTNLSKGVLSGSKSSEKSPLRSAISSVILKAFLRGDNIVPPELAPNHLVTINGVFPMTDDYFDIVARQVDLDVKPAKDVINSSNITRYKEAAASTLKNYRTIVEQKEKKKISLKDAIVKKGDINTVEIMVKNIVNNNDFLMNASLLPGFKPKDLNAVEYNYVTIGKKTIKIPVLNNEKIANQVIEESFVFLNDCLIESLTNNFVLKCFKKSELLNDSEEALIELGSMVLTEDVENISPLKELYYNILQRIDEDNQKLFSFITFLEEAERDYKKEYKNYHGKPKQRKERAARTAARELMIKKGRAKKGDGKDIDHKKPLRSGGSKGINNLRVRDKSENRSDNGHKKGETQKKGSWK